jgi:hypothetical protein
MLVNINVKSLSQNEFIVAINNDVNVFELKQRIYNQMLNPYRFEDLIVLYNKKELKNNETISFLENNSNIHIKPDTRPDHLRV